MPNLTLSLTTEVYAAMKKHPEIRWSEVARQAITKRLTDLETLDAILSKSKLTERDVRELSEKVNRGVWEQHSYPVKKQHPERRAKART